MPCARPWGSGGSTMSLGAGSFSIATYGDAPLSFAFWAKALAVSKLPAMTAASALMSGVIAFSLMFEFTWRTRHAGLRGAVYGSQSRTRTPARARPRTYKKILRIGFANAIQPSEKRLIPMYRYDDSRQPLRCLVLT